MTLSPLLAEPASDTVTRRPPCRCNDHQVDELRALVAAGHDQIEASHFLWGNPRTPELILEHARRTVRAQVRREFQTAFPWLRLPYDPSEV